jgi:glycine/D-amino acid oxidase-like deaminating enzyme
MNPTTRCDVIMAGGGVMGCATAYYLLQADPMMKVAIIKMDPDYKRNSTVLSDGNARLQFNLKENILISLYGMERLKTFSEDMAVGDWRPEVYFQQQGNLFLVDEENRATFIEREVAEVPHSASKVSRVRLTNGTQLTAKYVVNSAGAWGTKLARTAGIDLPIDPVKRQVFVLQTATAPQEIYPLTVFPPGLYLIQEHGDQFMCGKSLDEDPVGFDFTWDHDKFMDYLWPELVEYIPAFDRLKIVSGWSGLYAVNRFDGNVILGEWPELKGFLLVNGFSGHGFQQCHAIGRYLAETIRGVDLFLDLSIFSPNRVLENRPVLEGHGKLV